MKWSCDFRFSSCVNLVTPVVYRHREERTCPVRDFLSDVHFTDFVNFASVRSTYCACAMVVGTGVGVVIGVRVVHIHFMMEYTLMETSKSRSLRLASQGNPSPSPPQG